MENNSCIRLKADLAQINSCKETINEHNDTIELLANTLNLAGNQVRLKILFLLNKEDELCVCDMSDILNMKIAAISQHLRKLKDRNIIKPNRNAQTIYYTINPAFQDLFAPFFKLISSNTIYETV